MQGAQNFNVVWLIPHDIAITLLNLIFFVHCISIADSTMLLTPFTVDRQQRKMLSWVFTRNVNMHPCWDYIVNILKPIELWLEVHLHTEFSQRKKVSCWYISNKWLAFSDKLLLAMWTLLSHSEEEPIVTFVTFTVQLRQNLEMEKKEYKCQLKYKIARGRIR